MSSIGSSGVKHTQLTNGAAVRGAGELMIGEDGNLLLNNFSGRYIRPSSEALTQLQEHLSRMNLKVKFADGEL